MIGKKVPLDRLVQAGGGGSLVYSDNLAIGVLRGNSFVLFAGNLLLVRVSSFLGVRVGYENIALLIHSSSLDLVSSRRSSVSKRKRSRGLRVVR